MLFSSDFLIVASTLQNDKSDLRFFCVHGMNTGWGCIRRIFGSKRREGIDVEKLFIEELRTLYCATYYYGEQIAEGEVGGPSDTHDR